MGYNLITDSPQSIKRSATQFCGPKRKRYDELALEITSQRNTLARSNSGKWIYSYNTGVKEFSRESPILQYNDHPRRCKRYPDDKKYPAAISRCDVLICSFLQFVGCQIDYIIIDFREKSVETRNLTALASHTILTIRKFRRICS